MIRRVAYPFLVLPDSVIEFTGWLIGDPELPLTPATEMLENWDYARDLEVSAGVSLDWKGAAQALQLPADDLRLKLLLIAGTGTGKFPRRQDRIREIVIDSGSPQATLSAAIPGYALSGRLRLSLVMLLEAPILPEAKLAPSVRGSRLWTASQDILLEDGGSSRFPIETVSFSRVFKGQPQENAPWYLHWRPNVLNADFSGGVRLYVNSDRQEVLVRFVEGDGPTLQAMLGDVVSQMAASVLDQEESMEALAECEEGTVGAQIRGWLGLAFPGQSLSSIRAMRDRIPGRFRAAILAASDLGVSQ
jgi:hypothetical protein